MSVPVTEGGEETPSALVTLSGFQRFYAEKTHDGRATLHPGNRQRGHTPRSPSMPINAQGLPGPPFSVVASRRVALRSHRDPFARSIERGGKAKRKVSRRKY